MNDANIDRAFEPRAVLRPHVRRLVCGAVVLARGARGHDMRFAGPPRAGRYTLRMGVGTDLIYALAGVVSSPAWGANLLRTGKWRTDWAGRLGRVSTFPSQAGADQPQNRNRRERRTLLIHAVSVGEAAAIRSLVGQLQQMAGGRLELVVSCTTDTGVARAKSLYEPDVRVVRYPLDFSACVRRFLDGVRPDAVALVELEVWPNFAAACRRRAIPLAVINGRLSERSRRLYAPLRPLVRRTFAGLDAVLAQDASYAARFAELGVRPDRLEAIGSMKWDNADLRYPSGPHEREAVEALGQALGVDRDKPLIVAGSTGPDEEVMLLERCPADVQLLLAPRKPERFEEVARLHPAMVRRSNHPDARRPPPPTRAAAGRFILDTLGELRRAYALADVVIVGRSFNGWGGSDPIEPVGLGRPTLIGPAHHHFQSVVDALRSGGGLEVTDDPIDTAISLLKDRRRAEALAESGRAVILSHQGASTRTARRLLDLLGISAPTSNATPEDGGEPAAAAAGSRAHAARPPAAHRP